MSQKMNMKSVCVCVCEMWGKGCLFSVGYSLSQTQFPTIAQRQTGGLGFHKNSVSGR